MGPWRVHELGILKGTAMKQARAVSGYQIARQSIALTLSVLLIPFATGNLLAQEGGYAPLDPVGLDQLVAPIALYPDSLVAQILTASTYPQQVGDAANWERQTGGMPPDQRADEADRMPWDPSVKALTAFPSVLDNLARNYNWMSSLGNAYYNQPEDVMNAVQAARVQAQQAGYLRSTPQQRVYYSGGQVLIVPVNPEVVYVPYYDPWRVYGGGWVSPYSGYYLAPPPRGLALGLGIGFAAGISIGLFAHYGWGYHHWEPNWHGGVVVYNHNTYISRSTTVINTGHFGGYNRGVFEHEGRGVPPNFRPPVVHATAGYDRGPNVNRPAPNTFNRPGGRDERPSRDFADRPPAARPQAERPQPVRPEVERGQAQGRGFDRPQAERPQVQRPQAERPQQAQRPQVERQAERPQAQRPEPQRQVERPQAARPQQNERPQTARPAEGGGNRPQGREARPAPQGRPAEQHGRPEEQHQEHDHH
jgi:hypothetical protein